MCGIVGVVGSTTAITDVLEGLKKLEYRGYDSAGIAALQKGTIELRKEAGRISALENLLTQRPFTDEPHMAVGHTRWATHGEPTTANAHPHLNGSVAVVHNGIIENFQELRKEIQDAGISLKSETDTETVPALIHKFMNQGHDPLGAVCAMVNRVEGAFALGIEFSGHDNMLIGTRRGAPLCIGVAQGKNYLGSDPLALAEYTNTFIFLEDDDIAVLTPENVEIHRPDGSIVQRPSQKLDISSIQTGKAGYRHFMLKEMNEQPAVVSRLLENYLTPEGRPTLPNLACNLSQAPQINIVACGTAYYAGLVGKYYFEQMAGVSVNVDVASEFRYRKPPYKQGGVFIAVSQSGETADTLAALEDAKAHGQHVICITNVASSSIARASDTVLELMAGPEIAVASTKAFTGMVVVLALLALEAAYQKEDSAALSTYAQGLRELPAKLTQALGMESKIEALAKDIMHAKSMLYLGRGALQPLAFEGALKVKEISYIHAEGYASGEMKHGPIALVDEDLPVVNLATTADGLFEKTVSNMKEVEARRGHVILFTDPEGAEKLDADIAAKAKVFTLPKADFLTTPILFVIPLQLLAYHVAVAKGTDVDQPRNLAKSVTVE